MSRRAYQHPARFGQGLKASRQIRSVPYDRFRTCRTDMRRFADNDKTRRDPNASPQRQSVRMLQLRDLCRDFEAGANGAFSSVLLRMWKAEIDEYAVAEVLRDVPIMPGDGGLAGFAVLSQQDDEVFGIKFSPERRRSNQIDERHCELASFSRRRRSSLSHRGRSLRRERRLSKLRCCSQKFASVTQR